MLSLSDTALRTTGGTSITFRDGPWQSGERRLSLHGRPPKKRKRGRYHASANDLLSTLQHRSQHWLRKKMKRKIPPQQNEENTKNCSLRRSRKKMKMVKTTRATRKQLRTARNQKKKKRENCVYNPKICSIFRGY